MRSGGVPPSSRRSTRMVSTWVLPVPALALTQAEAPGSAAAAWLRCVCARRASRSFSALEAKKMPISGLLDRLGRPFGHAGEMGVAVVAIVEAGSTQRAIGHGLVVEDGYQAHEAVARLACEVVDVGQRAVLAGWLAAGSRDVAQTCDIARGKPRKAARNGDGRFQRELRRSALLGLAGKRFDVARLVV